MLRKTATSVWVATAFIANVNAQTLDSETVHQKWGQSETWTIRIDPAHGNGCYMENTLEDGTLVQIGFVPNRNGGFFAAYNAAWSQIKNGAVGDVQFDFGKSIFGGEYIGVLKGTIPGGYAFFNNPEFIKEFAKRDEVLISGEKKDVLTFKLTGTMKAINAVRNCDAEQQK